MKQSIQIFLFFMISLFIVFIYIMSTPSVKKEIEFDIKRVENKIEETIDDKKDTNVKKTDKYKQWEDSWVGRNTPIKSCYNNCQGLRADEFKVCSDKCLLHDQFYKQ